jgi:hypothetical protein
MPVTPKFHAVSEEALIDNTLTLFETNFKVIMDALYPAEATLTEADAQYLGDFRERSLGMVMGNELPCLGIGPIRNASTSSDDDSYLKEALRMDLAIAVADDNPQTVTRRIMRYMRAAEAVLRRGNKNDFFGIVNTTRTWGFSLDCEHVYSQDIHHNDNSIYFRDATLQVTVTIHEGQ